MIRRLKNKSQPQLGAVRRRASQRRAFTMAETLIAMIFMAIVIPAAMEGVSLASRAGVVARHKREAALFAERLLNQTIVTNQLPDEDSLDFGDTSWMLGSHEGEFEEAPYYRWELWGEPWGEDYLFLAEDTEITLHLVTAEVFFTAQGREYSVSLSTIVEEVAEEEEATDAGAAGGGGS
jgi:hypothetical protein